MIFQIFRILLVAWGGMFLLGTGCNRAEAPKNAPAAETRSPAQIHYENGLKLADSGDKDGARNAWETAIGLDPAMPQPYFMLAALEEQQGDPIKGAERLAALRRANPTVRNVEARQAELYFAADRYYQAMKLSREAVKREPDAPPGYMLLGLGLEAAGEPKQALEMLRKAHQLAPDSERVTTTLAQQLARTGRAKEAFALVEPLLQTQMRLPAIVYGVMGWLWAQYGREGKPDAVLAMDYLDKSLQADPNHAPANFEKGRLLARQKKFSQARPYLERARQTMIADPDFQETLGQVYVALKVPNGEKLLQNARNVRKLLVELHTARRRYFAIPQDTRNTLQLARLEAGRGSVQTARLLVNEVLQREPNNYTALDLINRLIPPSGSLPKR